MPRLYWKHIVLSAAFAVVPTVIALAAPQESDCPSPGSDEWRSYAHDNRQTSASSITVGNPNQVTLEWTTSFATVSNFTNPTIANGIVYQSSENRLNAIDLTDGSLIGIVAGPPICRQLETEATRLSHLYAAC